MKTVQLLTDNAKALYFDPERAALRPNLVFVRSDGSIAFEINELGLKGDPLDPDRKLAVVWGDSVVFSHGRGWPCLIDRLAPGWQFLNGGVEGDPYKNILRRASDLNGRHPVSLNLLMLGWHSFLPSWWAENSDSNPITTARTKPGRSRNGNEDLHAALTSFLRRVPNTVFRQRSTAISSITRCRRICARATTIAASTSSAISRGRSKASVRPLLISWSVMRLRAGCAQSWAFELLTCLRRSIRRVCRTFASTFRMCCICGRAPTRSWRSTSMLKSRTC
jgi:hypothetical protein